MSVCCYCCCCWFCQNWLCKEASIDICTKGATFKLNLDTERERRFAYLSHFVFTMKTIRRNIRRRDTGSAYGKGEDHDLPMEMNIPGLCTGGNALAKTYSRTENVKDVLKVRCDAELFNEAKEQPWYPKEPYAAARPRSDAATPTRRFSNRPVDRESFNYAKALLESDTELERLAQKISSQIRDSEMMEVAVNAEKAADDGLEAFSGRPSSFRVDATPGDVPGSYVDDEKAAKDVSDNGKIGTLQLRQINEVIPEFNHLNAHMRTHLFRNSVDESTLVFKEVKASTENRQDQSRQKAGSDIAKQSINFLRSLSGLRMMQRARIDFSQEKTSKHSSSKANATNPSLPSELHGSSSMKGAADSTGPKSKDLTVDVPCESSNQGDDGEDRVINPIFLSKHGNIGRPAIGQPEGPVETISLFDEGNEDLEEQSCPPSPLTAPQTHPPPNLLMTPRMNDQFRRKSSEFLTPERLRNIRQNENDTLTPDAVRYNFSPSSIIDSAYGNNQESPQTTGRSSLREDEARFLELPAIRDEMKEKDFGEVLLSQGNGVERRSIQMPQRRMGAGMSQSASANYLEIPNVSEKSLLSLDPEIKPCGTLSPAFTDDSNKDAKILPPQKIEEALELPLHQKPDEYRQDYLPILLKGQNNSGASSPEPPNSRTESAAKDLKEKETKACENPSKSAKVQSALEGIISQLSPKSSREPRESLGDSENNEFLNNYFYCAKPRGTYSSTAKRDQHRYRYYCGETVGGNGMLCHGVDSMCHGLDYLFPRSNKASHILLDPKRDEESGLSLYRDKGEKSRSGWLGALAINRFSFTARTAPGADTQGDGNFRPPFLKRSAVTENH